METYDKLVRDNIPKELDSKGINFEQHTASPEEYKKRLIEKLAEEVKELREDGNIEELADVLEVIEALKKFPEYTNVEEVRKKKLTEKGGFERRLILKGEKS
ncbi:MAG: nucleoside triphosphate pyrophosphohydrolase [Candidatus Parcubacteria bacterium]|nr:nucleoside triphosphate pyrophosphohydrolase [Candidatus Parcubacteria bacterium]